MLMTPGTGFRPAGAAKPAADVYFLGTQKSGHRSATLITQTGGDASQVPSWPSADFDSIYVVQLDAAAF
jgi:hypothetical protein